MFRGRRGDGPPRHPVRLARISARGPVAAGLSLPANLRFPKGRWAVDGGHETGGRARERDAPELSGAYGCKASPGRVRSARRADCRENPVGQFSWPNPSALVNALRAQNTRVQFNASKAPRPSDRTKSDIPFHEIPHWPNFRHAETLGISARPPRGDQRCSPPHPCRRKRPYPRPSSVDAASARKQVAPHAATF